MPRRCLPRHIPGRRWLLAFALACTAVFSASADAQDTITADTLTDEHVRKAIDAIVAELYRRKDPDHFWDPAQWSSERHGSTRQGGGYTALVTLALLYAGESYQDPRLNGAIQYLAEFPMEGTYAVAVRNHIWAQLPPMFSDQLRADTSWLIEGFSDQAPGWDYDQDARTTRQDNSLRQYGALGLWEAAKRGVDVPNRYWQMLEEAFLDNQLPGGGWNYKGDDEPARGSMVAAGLTLLFITQDFLHASEALELSRSGVSRQQQAIDRGLQWMRDHFSATHNPGRDGDYYYYMYGVERVGLASGLKFFGDHDWYREGAAELIRRFCAWDPQSRTMTMHERVAGEARAGQLHERYLAFGLMFLSRGRVPVAINKLQATDLAWNNRPRDVANLTQWIREHTETALNWQIVSLDAPPETWLDAPMLYLASHVPAPWLREVNVDVRRYVADVRAHEAKRAAGDIPADAAPPTPPDIPQLAQLKRYLDLGGTLLAVNEGSSRGFGESIERLGSIMYPLYEWRTLPDDHWAYTIHRPVRGRKPTLRALSNGVRELIILCPSTDLAQTFQARDTRRAEQFETAANIYFYASEMNRPRPRLDEHFIQATDDAAAASTRATIVRAMHSGAWNPEPASLEIFSHWLREARSIDLTAVDAPLSGINDLSFRPTMVLVSGVDEQEFTEAQIDAVRAYVESGGVILFETAGGMGSFTLGAERMALTALEKPVRSAQRSELITGRDLPGAVDLSRVEYRPYSLLHAFGSRETTPRLRSMRIDEHHRVLFSREDLTHGLLDQPAWGISGYSAPSARALLANIIQYALTVNTGG